MGFFGDPEGLQNHASRIVVMLLRLGCGRGIAQSLNETIHELLNKIDFGLPQRDRGVDDVSPGPSLDVAPAIDFRSNESNHVIEIHHSIDEAAYVFDVFFGRIGEVADFLLEEVGGPLSLSEGVHLVLLSGGGSQMIDLGSVLLGVVLEPAEGLVDLIDVVEDPVLLLLEVERVVVVFSVEALALALAVLFENRLEIFLDEAKELFDLLVFLVGFVKRVMGSCLKCLFIGGVHLVLGLLLPLLVLLDVVDDCIAFVKRQLDVLLFSTLYVERPVFLGTLGLVFEVSAPSKLALSLQFFLVLLRVEGEAVLVLLWLSSRAAFRVLSAGAVDWVDYLVLGEVSVGVESSLLVELRIEVFLGEDFPLDREEIWKVVLDYDFPLRGPQLGLGLLVAQNFLHGEVNTIKIKVLIRPSLSRLQ